MKGDHGASASGTGVAFSPVNGSPPSRGPIRIPPGPPAGRHNRNSDAVRSARPANEPPEPRRCRGRAAPKPSSAPPAAGAHPRHGALWRSPPASQPERPHRAPPRRPGGYAGPDRQGRGWVGWGGRPGPARSRRQARERGPAPRPRTAGGGERAGGCQLRAARRLSRAGPRPRRSHVTRCPAPGAVAPPTPPSAFGPCRTP